MCIYFIPTTDPPNVITIVFPIFYFPYNTIYSASLTPQYTVIIICVHVPAFMCTHARYIVIYIFIVCILLFIFRARINTLNPFKLTHYTLRAVRTLR